MMYKQMTHVGLGHSMWFVTWRVMVFRLLYLFNKVISTFLKICGIDINDQYIVESLVAEWNLKITSTYWLYNWYCFLWRGSEGCWRTKGRRRWHERIWVRWQGVLLRVWSVSRTSSGSPCYDRICGNMSTLSSLSLSFLSNCKSIRSLLLVPSFWLDLTCHIWCHTQNVIFLKSLSSFCH